MLGWYPVVLRSVPIMHTSRDVKSVGTIDELKSGIIPPSALP
jgi:hypothetical protein